MAKSSRSKIKRANRAVKREKNSKKELAKLEKLVELAKGSEETCAEEGKEYTVLGGAEEKVFIEFHHYSYSESEACIGNSV